MRMEGSNSLHIFFLKFALNIKNTSEYLSQADEIVMPYASYEAIPDVLEKYTADIIIQTNQSNHDIDFKFISVMNKKAQETGRRVIMCLNNIALAEDCINYDLPFYYGYPVTTWYEFNALKALGVAYIRLGAPLFFDIKEVAQCGIPIRAIPNVTHSSYLPFLHSWCGTWIRPEAMDLYEPYIAAIEFEAADPKQEAALFRVYKEKNWPGDLSLLVHDLIETNITNRMISPEVDSARLDCGQRCQGNGKCRICERAFSLADPRKVKQYNLNK